MRRPSIKFKLRRLMAIISLLCVVLAFMRHALRYWGPSEVTTIALSILLVTNILAWFQGPRWQVFWVGFGIFGWLYLTISLGSSVGEHLPTTWWLDELHEKFYAIPTSPTSWYDFSNHVVASESHVAQFRRAGQSMISLGIALLGGVGASLLFPAKRDEAGKTLPPEGSLLKPGWRDDKTRKWDA